MKRKIITTIIVCIALICGCQEKEKHIYRLPTSRYLAELEQTERAYKDSLDKYCALLDTAQINYYLPLWQAARDSSCVVMREEADAFMAAVDEEAARDRNKGMTTTETILIYITILLVVALIIYICTVNRVWMRIGWFFQDQWKRLKRYFNAPPAS